MKYGIFGLTIALYFSFLPAYSATPIKAGSTCSKQGLTKTYSGKKYTCIKSGKSSVWNKGVLIKKSLPTTSPTPSSTPTNTPTPSSTNSCFHIASLPTPVIKSLDLDRIKKRFTATINIPKIDDRCDSHNKITFVFSGSGANACRDQVIEIKTTPFEITCPDLVQQSWWRLYLTKYSDSLQTFILSKEVILTTPPIFVQPVKPEPRPTSLNNLPYAQLYEFCDEPYAGKWAKTSLNELLVCNTAPESGSSYLPNYYLWRKP